MTHGSLFSGIGGFDLAAQKLGWENVFHCEINPFGRKVLSHYWPNAKSYEDITKTDFTIWRGKLDILTGGFPCQPYSTAGKRKGKEDERHLWPEMLRAIREIKPRWIVGENVLGLVNWNDGLVFEEVQADLEAQGYKVQPYILPAASVNAPHRRDRTWFVAYSNKNRDSRTARKVSRTDGQRRPQERKQIQHPSESSDVWINADTNLQRYEECQSSTFSVKKKRFNSKEDFTTQSCSFERFPTQPPICSGNDGLSSELDGITFSKWRNESIKAYGNAIVPQVVLNIFKSIEAYESNH